MSSTPSLLSVRRRAAAGFVTVLAVTGLTTFAGSTQSAEARAVTLPSSTKMVTGDGETRYRAQGTKFRPVGPVTAPPALNARAWAVIDMKSGQVLGRHRWRKRLQPASTIKLLTALTAVRTGVRTEQHKVTRFEAGQTCSCVGLRVGYRYPLPSLLAGMLLPSGNDAAEAIAGSHPGGRAGFLAAMNQTARSLYAGRTSARTASGLTAAGQYSTARDLLIFLRSALETPEVEPYLDMPSAPVRTVSGYTKWVRHGTDYVEKYQDARGKSGYTSAALNTLVVSTTIDGRHLGVVTLGAPGGYSTSGTRALAVWAARNADNLASVGQMPKARRVHVAR